MADFIESSNTLDETIKQLRSKVEGLKRLDSEEVLSQMSHILENHAIYGTLNGIDLIEMYEVYKNESNETENEVFAIIKFGNKLNGHPGKCFKYLYAFTHYYIFGLGMVHGGITSLLFDNTFGWLYISTPSIKKSVTASLHINYK